MIRRDVVIPVTEDDIRTAADVLGIRLDKVSPEWLQEIADRVREYYMDEKYMAITTAIENTAKPEDYAGIDSRRAKAFCDWLARRVERNNGYLPNNGSHSEVVISGMKDGVVELSIEHGETQNEMVLTRAYVSLTVLNDQELDFDHLIKRIQF